MFEILSNQVVLTDLRTAREYATFEDRGNSYLWTKEEHDPDSGPDVLLNLSVSRLYNPFRQPRSLRLIE